jgi:CcmD family protein
MYDFLAVNQLYIVMAIVLINWLGLVLYLFRLDGRLSNLERSINMRDQRK